MKKKIRTLQKDKPSINVRHVKDKINKLEWKIQTTSLPLKEEEKLIKHIKILESKLLIYTRIHKIKEKIINQNFKERTLSDQIQQLGPGFMARSMEDGRVSEPREIPPHYQEILNKEAWDPGLGQGQPPPGSGSGVFQDTQGTIGDQEDKSDEAADD